MCMRGNFAVAITIQVMGFKTTLLRLCEIFNTILPTQSSTTFIPHPLLPPGSAPELCTSNVYFL